MKERVIQVKIQASDNYCTSRDTQKRCKHMKETYMCNQFCQVFRMQLDFDEEEKAYIRPIECIGAEQGAFFK